MRPPSILIRVMQGTRIVFQGEFNETVEIGRQQSPSEPLLERLPERDAVRIAIAECQQLRMSRRHLRLEPLSGNRVRVKNLSDKNFVPMSDGTSIEPLGSRDVVPPMSFSLHERDVWVEGAQDENSEVRMRAERTMLPANLSAQSILDPPSRPNLPSGQEGAVAKWLQQVTAVLQSAASSQEFFQKAAQALVMLVGLDSGRVLLWRDGDWEEAARCLGPNSVSDSDWKPSRRLLQRVLDEKRTAWHSSTQQMSPERSLATIQWAVAAPILNRNQEVIGAIYGDRLSRLGASIHDISEVDAILVETLAVGVGVGLSRLEQDRTRLLFEQFFSRDLAKQLDACPELLDGRDAEVTVLFCDIRHFSRISERIGPAKTVSWIYDVLSEMSECVLNRKGVLVDYVGDEMMAMWGAPAHQPDHATLATLAALDMLERLVVLRERWLGELGERMDLGIGINSGPARVGNVGSSRKFKYGPLGNTNNLASRVQGATKYLGSNVLITTATHQRLEGEFFTRRLCQVKVVNIAQPVELFEISPPQRPGWERLKNEYEAALQAFESGDFTTAVSFLGKLLGDFSEDGPALTLMSRMMHDRLLPPEEFNPVWTLPGK